MKFSHFYDMINNNKLHMSSPLQLVSESWYVGLEEGEHEGSDGEGCQ